MIMPRGGDELLLPVNPVFIAFSLVVAALLEMLPLAAYPASPDLLAVVLVFWNVHQPRRVSIGWAFLAGLVIDVHEGAVLGQHALAYTLLSYFAIALHRRLLWSPVAGQALQILPLFAAAHLAAMAARLLAGGMFPGWWVMLAPVAEAALWPVAVWLLLAPQRRPPDPDENRPL
jgi:rod shape-determining protein MreD